MTERKELKVEKPQELLFVDFITGQPIPNPKKKIRELNNKIYKMLAKNLKPKGAYKIDYRAQHPATRTGVAEAWGQRDTQEDAFAIGVLASFLQLSDPGRLQALRAVTKNLNSLLKAYILAEPVGSTFLATVLYKNRIYYSNVGDSTAFVVVVDAKGRVKVTPINKTHDTRDPVELARILKAGGTVDQQGYMNHYVNMSRSMGDFVAGKGHSGEPDVNFIDVTIPPGGKAFVINACDGLMEGLGSIEMIRLIVEKCHHLPPEMIATYLVWNAIEGGSGDNITVQVTPMEPLSEIVKYLLTLDGHGGYKVAEFLEKNFHAAIIQQIEAEILLEQVRQQLALEKAMKEQDQRQMVVALQQLFSNKKFLGLWSRMFHRGLTGSQMLDKQIIPLVQAGGPACLENIEDCLVTSSKKKKSKFTKIQAVLAKKGFEVETVSELRAAHLILLSGRFKLYGMLLLLGRRLRQWDMDHRLNAKVLHRYLNHLVEANVRVQYQEEIAQIVKMSESVREQKASSPAQAGVFSFVKQDEKQENVADTKEDKITLKSEVMNTKEAKITVKSEVTKRVSGKT